MMEKYCHDDLPAAQKRLVAWPYRDGSEVCGSAPFPQCNAFSFRVGNAHESLTSVPLMHLFHEQTS